MLKTVAVAVLLSILSACAAPPEMAAPANPYGSPDGQRERAGRATQELDRSIRY